MSDRKTIDKIAMMEAKLRQMERTNPVPKPTTPPVGQDKDVEMDDAATVAANRPSPPITSSLPHHPSLPMKPPPTLPKHLSNTLELPSSQNSKQRTSKTTELPSLTTLQSAAKAKTNPLDEAKLLGLQPPLKAGSNVQPRTNKTSKLIGVKIKAKEKSQP